MNDTVSIVFVLVALVLFAWTIANGIKRRRAARLELATRKARSALAEIEQARSRPLEMRVLWMDDERRERIARDVMASLSQYREFQDPE